MGPVAAHAAAAAALGLASALHCIGMCGGFTLLLVARGGLPARRALLFHGGRVATYAFLGSLAGGAAGAIARGAASRRAVALTAGALLVVLALQQAGLVARLLPRALGAGWRELVARAAAGARSLAELDAPAAPLLLGAANGLLPCGATAAALALAATSGSGLAGAATLAAFGAATLPALLLVAWSGRRLPLRALPGLRWLGAGATLAAAALLLWRGLAVAPACCHAG